MSSGEPPWRAVLVERVLGRVGRMMSESKSGYRDRRPTNVAVFNAYVAVATGDDAAETIWRGDLDVTLWEERLCVLARLLRRRLFLFFESDGHETYRGSALLRALAAFEPSGRVLVFERPASYIARDEDGTLRYLIPEETHRRFSWRVLRHRPRLWRFWRISYRRRQRHDPQETSRALSIGDRGSGMSPQLVLVIVRRLASLESIRTFEAAWYPAGNEGRRAGRALIDLMPSVRLGAHLVHARLLIWPGFMYELHFGHSRGRGRNDGAAS